MSHLANLAAALLLVALLALVLRRRGDVESKRVLLWRALLPSWRFFEAPDVSYLLLARSCDDGDDAPFVPVIPARTRAASALLFAPRQNLKLACHGLVEALMQELSELGEVTVEQAEQLISYRRVQHMVGYFLPNTRRYQLKVMTEERGQPGEELFVSPIYTRG